MKLAGTALWLVAVTACTERVQVGREPELPGLVALEVTPDDTIVPLAGIAAPPQGLAYTAIGTFVDGRRRDVTQLIDWTVDNPFPGEFGDPGNYTVYGTAAGHVQIRATSGDVVGLAKLTVTMSATITDSAFPPPANVESLFAFPPIDDATRSPELRYPSAATTFPQGLTAILFQYTRGTANDAFRLVFTSDVLELVVYTGTDRWQPDADAWNAIAHAHPDANVALAVAATNSAAPGVVYGAAAQPLRFARADPGGAIYFWSDASSGIMRGALAATSATKLYPTDSRCASCHVVSRDGHTMAMGYGGETLRTLDIPTLAPNNTPPTTPMGWATFSPDGKLVLVADNGLLVLRDALTGMPVGPDMGKVKTGTKFATHPDWSPDGRYVAVALSPMTMTNQDMKNGSIARIPYANGAWGPVETLVPAIDPMDNNYFPKFSPDGSAIAYVNARTAAHGAKAAELRIIAANGGPYRSLRIASHRVGLADDVPDLANTMPTWAPTIDTNTAWLAFASTRPYGIVRPTTGSSQIWVAAVDLSNLGDPSAAAFWLPCQDVTALSNNPIWAQLPSMEQ